MRAQIAELLRNGILTGELEPGAQVVESEVAMRLGVSRGPLREAMQQLVDEGLLVSVPYTGTRVVDISLRDINEIYAMRICLEQFAFMLIWDRRTDEFRTELLHRNAALKDAIDRNDHIAAIEAELELHGLVYEHADNRLLLNSWNGLRGHLQMYWAAHRCAHETSVPKRESHDDYLSFALGDSLAAIQEELAAHMRLGLETTKAFVKARSAATAQETKSKPTRRQR